MTSVALINASGPTDGVSFGSESYATALSELGVTVSWYQCVDYGRAWARPFPVPGHVVRGLGLPNTTLDMGVNRLWTFPRRVPELRDDIVFLADPTLVDVAPNHPRRAVKVHDLRPLSVYADRRLTRWTFRRAVPRLKRVDRVLAPTRTVQAELLRAGIASERTRVVPEVSLLGDHPDHIARSVARVREEGVLRVLCVGADRPYKNLRLVVRLAELLQRGGDPRRTVFTIVSRLLPATARWVRSLQLGNLRVVSDLPSLAQAYEEHDVLLQPSLYEGFGRPVVEAMGFGLPLVATRIPVMEEVVEDAGKLLPPEPLGPWAEVLVSLRDPAVLEDWARKSYARGVAFSPERFRAAIGAALLGN